MTTLFVLPRIIPVIFTICRQDPRDWAWGLHPDRGLDYKAKDGLSLEVCLDNPELINTAKCSLPRDLCLSNKQFTPLVGCSGQILSREPEG